MRRVELNLKEMQSEKAIHDFLKEHMDFPDYYGENLDALYDMLTEVSENICVEIHLCTNTDEPLYKFGKKLERVMEDAAQTVEYTDDGRMFAVFADCEPLELGGSW